MTPRILFQFGLLLLTATLACSSDPAPGSAAAGGTTSPSSGGSLARGGTAAGGSVPTTGGRAMAGGSEATSGGAQSGAAAGIPSAGGTPTAGTSGAAAGSAGVTSANGGVPSSGGGPAGTSGSGGSAPNGGASAGSAGTKSGAGGAAAGTSGGGTPSSGGGGGTSGTGAGGRLGTAGSTGIAGAASPGGFGQDTPAGLGGAVIKVTNLNAQGTGSLRAAIETSGPRVIVFEVGGVIDLNRARLDIREPFVTIAGQTAPAPGITLIRGGMRVMTHDVSIQHLRIRMGDAGAAASSGFEPDVTTDGAQAYNIVFDHVSVAWGVDENLSVSGPRLDGPLATSRRVTIRNSIIAEGLRNSVHEKGAHSMGTLIHDYCTEVAVVGNLYAHNDERNPWFKGFATGVIVNNVVYNPGKWAMRLGPVEGEWTASGITPEGPRVSIVGNYMRYGKDTPAGQTMVGSNSRGSAYLEDNIAVNATGGAVTITASTVTKLTSKPVWPDGLVALPAASVVEHVLAHAGARPKERDSVDQRIVADFKSGGGGLIDSQAAVGGYPAPAPTTRPLTVPTDVAGWLRDLAAALE